MTDRIAQLERLVTSLVDNNKTTSIPEFDVMSPPVRSMLPPSPGRLVSGDAASFQTPRHWGQVQFVNNETKYVPGTHWSVILSEVILGKEDAAEAVDG